VIGYSGGVDSAYLASAALDALGADRVLAVTGRSPSYPAVQYEMALQVARAIELPHVEIETAEVENPKYAANPTDRCYYCKSELYGQLTKIALERSAVIVDGSNADDRDDYRPGMTAARELGVRSPLQEAGLTKDEIRELSRRAGLPTWDLAASPCLASRIAYGIEVTPRRLRQIEETESRLRELCEWQELRVRHHGDVARLEVAGGDLQRFIADGNFEHVVNAMVAVGFSSGCVDLAGYRRGALNEAIGSVDGDGPPAAAKAETGLSALGIPAEVRTAGRLADVAMLEATPEIAERLLGEDRESAIHVCQAAGFRYVALFLF
jgi:uncharacterized protein